MPDAKRLAREAQATMSRFTGRHYPEFWKELEGMPVAAVMDLLRFLRDCEDEVERERWPSLGSSVLGVLSTEDEKWLKREVATYLKSRDLIQGVSIFTKEEWFEWAKPGQTAPGAVLTISMGRPLYQMMHGKGDPDEIDRQERDWRSFLDMLGLQMVLADENTIHLYPQTGEILI